MFKSTRVSIRIGLAVAVLSLLSVPSFASEHERSIFAHSLSSPVVWLSYVDITGDTPDIVAAMYAESRIEPAERQKEQYFRRMPVSDSFTTIALGHNAWPVLAPD